MTTDAPLDPQALFDRRAEVQVVDVRYPNEWEAGHIDGAVHIPRDDLDERSDELDRDRPVVTVCRSGQRSAEAASALADEGFHAQNLDGGLQAWAAQGLALVADDGRSGSLAEPEPPADERPEHMQQLQSEFISTTLAVQEHFGDHQPTEQEVRAFLKQRLIDEGKTPEQAEEMLTAPADSASGGSSATASSADAP